LGGLGSAVRRVGRSSTEPRRATANRGARQRRRARAGWSEVRNAYQEDVSPAVGNRRDGAIPERASTVVHEQHRPRPGERETDMANEIKVGDAVQVYREDRRRYETGLIVGDEGPEAVQGWRFDVKFADGSSALYGHSEMVSVDAAESR